MYSQPGSPHAPQPTPVGTLQVRLLGGLSLGWNGHTIPPLATNNARSLFAYLITHRSHTQSRDLLAGLFWPDLADARARRRLSQALWRIRHALHPLGARQAFVLSEGDGLRFNTHAPYWLDTEEFEKLLQWETGRTVNWEDARLDNRRDTGYSDRIHDFSRGFETSQAARSSTAQSPHAPGWQPADLSRLRRAVSLYQGDFMSGSYDDWLMVERERLREAFLLALVHLVQQCKVQDRYEEALFYAQRLASEDPLREEGHREVMRLCNLLGRTGEALQQYEACRATLASELRTEPNPSTVALYQEIAVRSEEVEPAHLPQARNQLLSPLLETFSQVSLVGRERERAILVDLLEQAIGGRSGMALLEGEAGVGKTRLLQEVARDAEWRGALVLWGQGRESAETPPYGPLADALRPVLSPLRARLLAQSFGEHWLRAACPAIPELAQWLPDLPSPVSLPQDVERDRLREALARLVIALGRMSPLVLLLEDMQWLDQSTLDALGTLAGSLCERHLADAGSAVLVITTFRSGETRERPGVWEALQTMDRLYHCHRLSLPRLSEEETAELVRRGLGLSRKAPRFEARLFGETMGNPLFVVETLRALHDEGLLFRSDAGDWRTPWDDVTTDYAELPLPQKVYQVISRRLKWLGPDEREIIRTAAVLGNELDVDLLLKTSNLEQEWTLAALSELLRRRLLQESLTQLRFSHAKVREAVLLEMGPVERKRLHRQAGEALESMRPEQVDAMAYHFVAAEAWEKALAYSHRAGDQAREVYAGAEALAHYCHALDAWEQMQAADPQSAIGLHQARGETAQDTGRFDDAEKDFRLACVLAQQAGDTQRQARAMNSLSYLTFQRGECKDAIEAARQARDLAQSAGSDLQVARALLNEANALRNLGLPQEAILLYGRAEAIFRELGDPARLADCLNRSGFAHLFRGDYLEAKRLMTESLAMRRQLDDKVGVSYSLTNLTALHYLQGQFAEARKTAAEALRVARDSGDPYGEDAAVLNLGLMDLEQGLLLPAMSLFQEAIAIARRIGDIPVVAETLAELGRAHLHIPDIQRARQLLSEAVTMIATGGECWHEPKARAYLSQALLATGEEQPALAAAQAGLRRAKEIGDPWSEGITHRAVAQATCRVDHSQVVVSAQAHFEQSVQILRQVGARAELARSLAAYGHFLARAEGDSNRGRSTKMVEEARATFHKLGMERDLADLEASLAGEPRSAQVVVRLPIASAPTGRPVRDDEWVDVTWTVAAPDDKARSGKVAVRQHRLLRLLREAAEQNGAPTVGDLARALGVGRATIKRDLLALRQASHHPRTRGSRVT